jgi:hypothetical protein
MKRNMVVAHMLEKEARYQKIGQLTAQPIKKILCNPIM